MKELLLMAAGVLISWALSAQTVNEIFLQNSTQLQYLEEQIAALQIYAQTLQSGYHVVSSGLDTIDRIKESDFALHAGYFSSLDDISPAVNADVQVADIRLYNARLPTITTAIAEEGRKQAAWSALTAGIAANLLAAANIDGQLLDEVLTDGQLQLEDAERLKLIGTLYAKAKERYGFALDVLGKLEVNGQ
jgi:hypothetical protein